MYGSDDMRVRGTGSIDLFGHLRVDINCHLSELVNKVEKLEAAADQTPTVTYRGGLDFGTIREPSRFGLDMGRIV